MPRENRKRGKKYKNKNVENPPLDLPAGQPLHDVPEPSTSERHGGPSWIIPAPHRSEEVDTESPFGDVDNEVKAYFRTVDIQIRDWQENEPDRGEMNKDLDPNEERRLFFVAALTEMSGKEKQLATDPDCSVILERMMYSMDDFVRRVFMDSLTGSYNLLFKHRFASHVCQTLFTVASDTVYRECRGILPEVPDPDRGELRTLTQLVLDMCEELIPTFPSLIMDPFASHAIRAVLLLLSPSALPSDSYKKSNLRSKRSSAWKARQGPMKSVFPLEDTSEPKASSITPIPAEFRRAARKLIQVIQDELDENEVRALAANKVACPVLQILLEVEADQEMADSPGSLMDRVMVGIITSCHNDSATTPEPSDYLNTVLRDAISSHVLETLITRSPDAAFTVLWTTYFQGKLARLAGHPVANFVVVKALDRTTTDQLAAAYKDLEGTWKRMIKSARTGVLRAMIDRAAVLHTLGEEMGEAVLSAFDLVTAQDRNLLVPCALSMLPLQEYQSASDLKNTHHESQQKQNQRGADGDPLESKVQGAILLQSLLRLPEPHNYLVIDSISSLAMEDLLTIAHHPTSSRILDVLLESPTVPLKAKRGLVLSFIGNFHLLVDDRIGSRIGDRCWAFADTYLKEKIGRSLIPHEQFLAGSHYGKFFARNLNLYLLQRRPEEWRTIQADRRRAEQEQEQPAASSPLPEQPPPPKASTKSELKKRKRDSQPKDEIDAVFNTILGKKAKKGALGLDSDSAGGKKDELGLEGERDEALRDVLGAISAAPKDDRGHGKWKNARRK